MFTLKELNIQQTKWIEFLKDYDTSVINHPGKANLLADALSCMSMGSGVSHLDEAKKGLAREYIGFLGWG